MYEKGGPAAFGGMETIIQMGKKIKDREDMLKDAKPQNYTEYQFEKDNKYLHDKEDLIKKAK